MADPRLPLSWCEVDGDRLAQNMTILKGLLGPGVHLGAVVKSEAYGHGLELSAQSFLKGGADWLVVQYVEEAMRLREAGLDCPILILGYTPSHHLDWVRHHHCHMVLYDFDRVQLFSQWQSGPPLQVHIKIETGNHRQGLSLQEALALAEALRPLSHVQLVGLSSHFANVEDTTDHRYADQQVARFRAGAEALRAAGFEIPYLHMANSAATVLWPPIHLNLVRAGLISYGMWPSPETLVSTFLEGRPQIDVGPALTWKAQVVQVKDVPRGAYIGYGCSYMTTHDSRIAVVPVGYFEGYDRRLSNLAHVLIHGERAPVRGRVCMNFIMVDITDIPQARAGDGVVLLGAQGEECISAEMMAQWMGTINYEVTTRIAAHIPRLLKGKI